MWLYVAPEKDVLTRACEVNISFSGVTHNLVFTDAKTQYLQY